MWPVVILDVIVISSSPFLPQYTPSWLVPSSSCSHFRESHHAHLHRMCRHRTVTSFTCASSSSHSHVTKTAHQTLELSNDRTIRQSICNFSVCCIHVYRNMCSVHRLEIHTRREYYIKHFTDICTFIHAEKLAARAIDTCEFQLRKWNWAKISPPRVTLSSS